MKTTIAEVPTAELRWIDPRWQGTMGLAGCTLQQKWHVVTEENGEQSVTIEWRDVPIIVEQKTWA